MFVLEPRMHTDMFADSCTAPHLTVYMTPHVSNNFQFVSTKHTSCGPLWTSAEHKIPYFANKERCLQCITSEICREQNQLDFFF